MTLLSVVVVAHAKKSRGSIFHDEYVWILGESYTYPLISPVYVGAVHPAVLPSVAWSASGGQNQNKRLKTFAKRLIKKSNVHKFLGE